MKNTIRNIRWTHNVHVVYKNWLHQIIPSLNRLLFISFITIRFSYFFDESQRHGANVFHLIQSDHQTSRNVRVFDWPEKKFKLIRFMIILFRIYNIKIIEEN